MNDCKMEFGFNEERINKDGEYTVEEVYQMLDEIMNKHNLHAIKQGIYEGEYTTSFSNFIYSVANLSNEIWFRKYCNKWYFTNPEDDFDDVYSHMVARGICL